MSGLGGGGALFVGETEGTGAGVWSGWGKVCPPGRCGNNTTVQTRENIFT